MKGEDFRIDGFYPSKKLCELLYQSSVKPGWKDRFQFMVFHLWLRAETFSLLKPEWLRGIRKSLGEELAALFTSLAKRSHGQRGTCERIVCSENGRFNLELTKDLMRRVGLNENKAIAYEALLLLHRELMECLFNRPWSSGVIVVSCIGDSIVIDYCQPFPDPPDYAKIFSDEKGWEV